MSLDYFISYSQYAEPKQWDSCNKLNIEHIFKVHIFIWTLKICWATSWNLCVQNILLRIVEK